jgi:hypothetical protein
MYSMTISFLMSTSTVVFLHITSFGFFFLFLAPHTHTQLIPAECRHGWSARWECQGRVPLPSAGTCLATVGPRSARTPPRSSCGGRPPGLEAKPFVSASVAFICTHSMPNCERGLGVMYKRLRKKTNSVLVDGMKHNYDFGKRKEAPSLNVTKGT